MALEFAELKVLEVRCQCGTIIVTDLQNDKALIPARCPGCNTEFPDAFRKGARDFRDAYRLLVEVSPDHRGPSVAFRLPLGDVS